MRNTRWIVALAAFAIVAAACGDDSTTSATTTTAAGAATTASSAGGTAAATCKIDRAVKLVGLAEKPPEGPNAIPDFANGWEMGVEDANKAGVCGQKFDYERLPSSPTDTASAKTNFLSALDKKADVMVGLNNSAIVIALAADIKSGATPIILNSGSVGIFVGAPTGNISSEWGFVIRPRNAGIAGSEAEYMVKELGKKKIGLVCATQAFGVQSCDAAKPVIEANGATVVAREDTDVSATNLTNQVLDMKNKGVDGVIAFQFPNVAVVLANQAVENGLNVPIMAGASAGLGVATKNVKPDALKILQGIDDCAPASEDRAKDFATKYRAKYNIEPQYAAAEAYDQVMILAEAIKKAGKIDKKAIADALRTTVYKGVCDDYKADAGQGLHHRSVFETFDAKGLPVVVKEVSIPAPAGGG
jgi:branched-chain amino acid transport system substrate-binding protein